MRFCRSLTFILAFLLATPAFSQMVIVNKQSATTELSRSDLRSIFLMRVTEWPDGSPVRVFVLESSNDFHLQFCQKVLGVFPYQLQQSWDRRVFSGTGRAPQIVSSMQKLKMFVSSTPGAIGYAPDEGGLLGELKRVNIHDQN